MDKEKARKRYLKRRRLAFALGGGSCQCCGEADEAFLEVDHVHNDGNLHRRFTGGIRAIISRVLKDNHWPSNLQLLCANCHKAKTIRGTCPHQEEP